MKTIHLSNEQSEILYQILSHVGGSPLGPRGEMDLVRRKLIDKGIDVTRQDFVIYDGKVNPNDLGHLSPALYIETKSEHERMKSMYRD